MEQLWPGLQLVTSDSHEVMGATAARLLGAPRDRGDLAQHAGDTLPHPPQLARLGGWGARPAGLTQRPFPRSRPQGIRAAAGGEGEGGSPPDRAQMKRPAACPPGRGRVPTDLQVLTVLA